MGEFSFSDILEDALRQPPSKAPKESPRHQSFDYRMATPGPLAEAVHHVKTTFSGIRAKELGDADMLVDDIDVFIEQIVVGKLSRLKPNDIKKSWFVRGIVKLPNGGAFRMSQLDALVRGINSTVGQLARLGERRRALEEREVDAEGKANARVVGSLERVHERKSELEKRLKHLTVEFLNSLSSIAMLIAQE